MSTTVTATIPDYLRDQRASGHAAHTLRLRGHFIGQWAGAAAPLAGGPVTMLASIRAYLGDRPDWSPQTRASAACAIRSWLRWAHSSGIGGLPDPGEVDVPRVPRRSPRPLDDAVIRAALAGCDPDTGLMILLGREAGLRRGEIARVHSDDLTADGCLLVSGKGGRQRVVPLSATLARRLRTRPAGWVFPAACDPARPVHPRLVGKRVTAALTAGTPHRLRHTFATAAYRSRHDLLAVQQLLGHSSVATTMGYVGLDDDALRRSVDAASLAAGTP